MDPICTRVGGDFGPQGPRFGDRGEGRPQISRDCGFQCLRRELERDQITWVCASSFAQLAVYFEPVAFLAVWLESGAKGDTVDGGFDRCHAT